MAGSDFERMEKLNDYWDGLVRSERPEVADVDAADIAATVQTLHALDDAPAPDPAFGERLWKDLMRETFAEPRSGRASVSAPGGAGFRARLDFRRWPLVGLAAVLAVALALGAYAALMKPPEVSAEEIARRAREAAASPAAVGIRSFVATERHVGRPGNPRLSAYAGFTGEEQIRSETKRWYEAPNRWRLEGGGTVVDAQGKELPNRDWRRMSVSDGKDVWNYDAKANSVTVHEIGVDPAGKPDSYGGESTLGQGTMDPSMALQASNSNVRPKLQGEEVVAGRTAYVLAFPTGVPSASAPEMNGPRTVWVDKETYFVLKVEQISGTDGRWLSTDEVTSIQYNVAIDPATFTFTPPRGAKVDDQRPKPAPTRSEFQRRMEDLARQADFPLFLPSQIPNGLVPRHPKSDETLGLQVEYAPPAEADTTSFPAMTLRQQKATQSLVSRWTERAESVSIGGAKGWLRRGFRNVDGTGGDSAAMVLRDGTLLSVSSMTLSPEELLKVAASLEPVPGGHAPLPNPTAPTIDEVRRRASFKVLLPGYVPAELTPEPPVAGSNQGSDRIDALTVIYHGADGAVALRLAEGPPRDPSSMARPMLTAPEVPIKPGITGRMMDASSVQTLLLWWVQDGTHVSLETRVLSREELLKVAASMSTTADLGRTEPVAGRPTPTPVPAPSFEVLRPTWLPEQMAVREQYQPDPTGRGSQIVIGFDPRPEDTKPHGVLTLTEMARDAAGERRITDPEAIREEIGGREVTVIMRGEDWITLLWEQGGVALMLTNPYDPPGHPRYTPEQLRRVVESVR